MIFLFGVYTLESNDCTIEHQLIKMLRSRTLLSDEFPGKFRLQWQTLLFLPL